VPDSEKLPGVSSGSETEVVLGEQFERIKRRNPIPSILTKSE
jgi:hypothetical protein